MNALIASLKFNPGHFSHLIANYKLLEKEGYRPYLYIHPLFNQMDEDNEFRKINSPRQLKQLDSISLAIFWFPSLKNIREMYKLKRSFKSQIIYIYHEPFDSVKSYHNSGFGFKKILKIYLINIVTIPMLLLADDIILPSETAHKLYKKKYKLLNNHYSLIPLIFDDEAITFNAILDKKYISYIGTIAADHAFNRFIEFIDIAIENNWFINNIFIVATGSNIPIEQLAILEKHKDSKQVEIWASKLLTNSEINNFYRQSIIVWNAYNRSVQSGVLPKAYMFGAAVIGLFKNANEFVNNHITGVLISDNKNILEIKNAMEEIIEGRDYFFKNCRLFFLETFYYESKVSNFKNLLKNTRL